MKLFIPILFLNAFLFSCTDKSPDLLVGTFNSLADSSDRIAIITITTYWNGEDTGITLNKTEIQNLREYFKQSKRADSCGFENGQFVFYKKEKQIGNIAFSISPDCPVVYIFDGQHNTFRLSYRAGMMLGDLLNKSYKASVK